MAEKIRVFSLDDLAEMIPVCVNHQDVPYCVIKTSEGVKAFVAVCPHENKAMNPPLVVDDCLVCPFHKVAFDAVSGKVRDARKKRVTKGLPQVQTEILDGVVYLKVIDEHQSFMGKSKWKRLMEKLSRFRFRATKVSEG
jgi:nitrite reductase/ring-hydroxylating ferredoxin subunit